MFNSYFSSVFTDEDTTNAPDIETQTDGTSIETIEITQEIVKKHLDKLNISKAGGPDGIHARILQECSEYLSVALEIIYNKSLESGNLPKQWKEANVKPLYKKGKKQLTQNYRPVSLTSVCCKVLEKIIRNNIVKHLESLGVITNDQHGFREGRSCNTQLLEIMEIWTSLIDKGIPWDCAYLDFAKAFDSVPHQRLIKKIESYGIKGQLLKWVTSFLTNRQQRVIVGNKHSNWANVKSGIPQGSVLGPILFIIYINDLPNEIKSYSKMFADDTKIFKALYSIQDSTTLQDDLIKLAEWSNIWQLPFNESKCKIIHYGKKNPNQSYQMNGHLLETVHEEKDLGVTFDSELKFSTHIRNIVSKANSRVGIIKRTFDTLDTENFKLLYKSLVRPILEYCSNIWHPILIRDMSEIEKVQKRATKLVTGLEDLPYENRLKTLNITTLEYRRNRNDMLQVYRLINGLDNTDLNLFFQLDTSRRTRGHSYKLTKPRANTTIRANVFSHRAINPWNALNDNVVCANTINSFKDRLEAAWNDKPVKFSPSFWH